MSVSGVFAMLHHALDYAARGWKVFPCHAINSLGFCTCGRSECGRPGKHPIPARGMLDGTAEEHPIRRWWSQYPTANIGIYCAGSGLVVVDVDPIHGGDESLDQLVDACGGDILYTLTALTGGGGRHLYYQAPETEIRNFAGWLPGIDTRSAGYVIAPPSNHVSGGVYQWVPGPLEPAPMPAALQDWFLSQAKPAPAPIVTLTPPPLETAAYVQAALDAECDRVRSATEGNRNNTLNRAAFALGTLVGAGVLPSDVARSQLWDAAHNWPGKVDWKETERTLNSGLKGGILHPRQLPESALAPRRPVPPRPPREEDIFADEDVYPDEQGEGTDAPIAGDAEDLEAERLRALTLTELYALAEAAGGIQWIVPNGIAHGYVHLMSAPPKSGKTWLALTLARAVCTGEPWAGEGEVEAGVVLWIDEEMGPPLIARRLTQLGFTEEMPFHTLSLARFRLDQGGDVARVMAEATRLGASLIVIDSLRRVHQLDENDNSQIRNLMPMLKALAGTGAAVVVLHHDRKRTLNDGDVQERSSGALDLIAQVDMVFGVKRDKASYSLACRSSRLLGEEGAVSIAFRLENREDGTVAVIPLDPKKELKNAQAELEYAIVGHVSRNPYENTNQIREGVKGRREDVSAALHRLVESGRLEMVPGPRRSKTYRALVTNDHEDPDDEGYEYMPE